MLINLNLRRREELERLVLEQTCELRESKESLQESEALQRALLDNLPTAVILVDVETQVIERANNHVAALFGGTVDSLIGQQCQTIFSVCSNAVTGACAGCDIASSEHDMLQADGNHLQVLRTFKRIQWQGRAKMLHCFVDVSGRKRMEDLLRQTHERLLLSTRAGDVGIWDYDVLNNKLVWDDQMFRHYGITRDQFGGAYEAWLSGVHPKDRQLSHEGIQLALRDEKAFNAEFRVLWPDGSTHHLHAVAIVQRDASGQPTHMVGINWDITAQKQSEELLREKAALLEAQTNESPDGVLVIAQNNKRILVNHWVIEMFDVPELILDDDDHAPLLNHIANLAKKPELFLERVHYLNNHSNEISRDEIEFKSGMVVERYSSPVLGEYGKNYGRIWRFHDITERKRAEAHLIKINRNLEQATVAAQMANTAKSEFMANMSHEVRTPMNGVLGMVGLLLDTSLSEDQRLYAKTARASGEALLALLNDILDFSEMEVGKLEIKTLGFSLRTLLDDFIGIMSLQAREKGLALGCVMDPNVPVDLQGDSGRLRQVLINLTGNAIKFTAHGEVAIRVSVVSETLGEVRLRFAVRDTGIGIPSDKLGRLFERFYQVDGSRTRAYGGMGLGLAISKQLTEMMGGEIGVESQEDKGSEFWFTALLAKRSTGIPACAPLSGERQRDANFSSDLSIVVSERELSTSKPVSTLGLALGHGLTPARILVVEDNLTNRQVVMGILKKLGFIAEMAVNGVEAVKALENSPYGLVLMDVQMPVMDGLDATRIIRDPQSRVLNHQITIVALTAHARQSDREQCLQAGMNDLITKPIEVPALVGVLKKWLKPNGGETATAQARVTDSDARIDALKVALENNR